MLLVTVSTYFHILHGKYHTQAIQAGEYDFATGTYKHHTHPAALMKTHLFTVFQGMEITFNELGYSENFRLVLPYLETGAITVSPLLTYTGFLYTDVFFL